MLHWKVHLQGSQSEGKATEAAKDGKQTQDGALASCPVCTERHQLFSHVGHLWASSTESPCGRTVSQWRPGEEIHLLTSSSSALHWSELSHEELTPSAPGVHYQGPPAATWKVNVACHWSPKVVGRARDLEPDSLLHLVRGESVAQELGEATRV